MVVSGGYAGETGTVVGLGGDGSLIIATTHGARQIAVRPDQCERNFRCDCGRDGIYLCERHAALRFGAAPFGVGQVVFAGPTADGDASALGRVLAVRPARSGWEVTVDFGAARPQRAFLARCAPIRAVATDAELRAMARRAKRADDQDVAKMCARAIKGDSAARLDIERMRDVEIRRAS